MIPRERLHVDVVRAALSVDLVWSDAGCALQGTRRVVRTTACPIVRKHGRRDSVAVDRGRGRWRCWPCSARSSDGGGDALAALAAFRGLDLRRDFPRVLAIGAELAGVRPDTAPADIAARLDAHARRIAELAQRDALDRRAAAARASATWQRLSSDDARGRRYLDGRGLDATRLIDRAAVRFGPDGSPAVALRDERGGVVNVARRSIEPTADPKVRNLPGSIEGALIGCAADIDRGALVVVCEGVTDALAATLAWPCAIVLGAPGAWCLPTVAAVAARRVVAVGGGRVVLSLDSDDVGDVAGERAIDAMLVAGLPASAIELVELDDAHDLAAAWASGWRPRS